MLANDANALRAEIEFLLSQYPELADDEILRADMLEGSTDIREVLTDLNRTLQDTKALIDGTQGRMDELAERRLRFRRRTEFVRDLMQRILESAQIRKIELPEVTLSLKNNPQQIIGEPDPEALPDDLVKIAREPDKKKIRAALMAGCEVPGVVLSNAPPSLMIKVK
jgi:hypothetical protein